MRYPSRCLLSYLVVAGLGCGLLAAQPPRSDRPAGPDLSGFKTVDTCVKNKLARATPEPAARQLPYLGVHVDKNAAGQIVVVDVEPDSPAAKAGLQKDDVLRKLGGRDVKDAIDLRDALQYAAPGEKTRLA